MKNKTDDKKNGFGAWLETKTGKWIFFSAITVFSVFLLTLLVFLFLSGPPAFLSDPDTQDLTTQEFNTMETNQSTRPSSEPDEEVAPEKDENESVVILPATPDDEMRGVYIASVLNINFPSQPGLTEEQQKMELDSIVSLSRSAGFDTLFFQVRPTGDALYPSKIFPTSRYLVKSEGDEIGFDPFQYVIEKAKEYNMDVVAWVNPYRITNFKSAGKEEALNALSDQNPAKLHPEWTVFYGGKLYYNPALSQVRDLIVSGVREICENYDVKGIIYDDYFYPYPVSGESFDDAAQYAAYDGDLSLEDWRRENVNQMVKYSFDTVKSVSRSLSFGVSPFGIWKNASSDPKGSNTKGTESYSALFCDPLAWIEGGYVDYIAPQIYWERGSSSADFATLTRWWSAQVDGTGVDLYISHAAYKVSDFKLGADEIIQQIAFARAYMGVAGSIQYGFDDIKKNTGGILDCLRDFYDAPYVEELVSTGVSGVRYAYPQNGYKTSASSQFVTVASDPRYPVYSSYGKIGRTKSGLISVLVPLKNGENVFTLTQNGKDYSLKIQRVTATSSQTKAETLSSFEIVSFSPSDKKEVLVSSGKKLSVSVTAPADCTVTASLGGAVLQLKPTKNPSGEGEYLKEVYTGYFTVSEISEGDAPVSKGSILFTCKGNGKTVEKEGPEVFVIPNSYPVSARVKIDYTHVKKSPNSSFYDDHTPASKGMTARVVSVVNGYCELSFGAYVALENVELLLGEDATANLTKVTSTSDEKATSFRLTLGGAPHVDLNVDGNRVTVTLLKTKNSGVEEIVISPQDALFRSVSVEKGEGDSVVLSFLLRSSKNYYGMNAVYENGDVILTFRQPQSLAEGEKPLQGKTVVLDAGHGGSDGGAAGFLAGFNEEDLNLAITKELETELKALGANVIMSRTGDTTVSLYERMDLLTATDPDFSISIHHNSVAETKDPNTARGTWGLYWSPSGISLTDAVRASTASQMGYYDYGTKSQMLALCRNHRFPQTLLEVGFICSPAEFQNALREDYAETVAKAVTEGVLDWYRLQEAFLKEMSQ